MFQQVLISIFSSDLTSKLLSNALCISASDVASRLKLFNTITFCAGFSTIIQIAFGSRWVRMKLIQCRFIYFVKYGLYNVSMYHYKLFITCWEWRLKLSRKKGNRGWGVVKIFANCLMQLVECNLYFQTSDHLWASSVSFSIRSAAAQSDRVSLYQRHWQRDDNRTARVGMETEASLCKDQEQYCIKCVSAR